MLIGRKMLMSDKTDKHMIQELKEMVKEKKPDEPIEKLLTVFCNAQEFPWNMPSLLQQLVEKGEIKEK